jgi:DNA-binding PadR family transcriptional regulator
MMGRGHEYKGNRVSLSQFLMAVMLRKGPMYGYELLKALRKAFDGTWVPKTGALYPALRRLEEHGLIVREERDGKDYYSLSGEGRTWLDEHLASISSEVLFMHHYFEVLSEAALEVRGPAPSPLPSNLFLLLQDAENDKDKVRVLRMIREMLLHNLQGIDAAIERHEKEIASSAGLKLDRTVQDVHQPEE